MEWKGTPSNESNNSIIGVFWFDEKKFVLDKVTKMFYLMPKGRTSLIIKVVVCKAIIDF
jgi:hypothetical protein